MSSPFRDAAAVTLDASSRGERARVPGAPINGRFHPPSAVKGLVPRPRLHRNVAEGGMTYRPGPSHRFPPDWRPPKPREPSDRTTIRVVLSLFAAGMIACGIAFALLR